MGGGGGGGHRDVLTLKLAVKRGVQDCLQGQAEGDWPLGVLLGWRQRHRTVVPPCPRRGADRTGQ